MASLFLKMACRWVPRMTELLAVSLDSEEEKAAFQDASNVDVIG